MAGSSRSSGPVVGSANFFLSYRDGGSRCDAGLQSELIIACRNCAAAGRVHIIQLARGRAASLARSLARASSCPSSEDRSRRASGPFPLRRSSFDMHAVPCPTSLTHSCLPRDPLSRPLSDAAFPFLFPRESRDHAAKRKGNIVPLENADFFSFVDFQRAISANEPRDWCLISASAWAELKLNVVVRGE